MSENFKISNKCGEKLFGIMHKAVSPTKQNSKQLVIVCHGRLTNKDMYFIPELCEQIAANGFNAFRFDFAGNGESQGKFEESTVTKAIEDIKAVVDNFTENGFEIFCLIGHSLGAVEVLLYQAKHGSASKLVSIGATVNQAEQTLAKFSEKEKKELDKNGFFTITKYGKKFNVSRKYFYDRLNYGDIKNKIKDIKVPVLIIHGTIDTDVDVRNAKLLSGTLTKSKLCLIVGAGHFFEQKNHEQELIGTIIGWLKNKK